MIPKPGVKRGRDHSKDWRFGPYVLCGAIPKPNRGRRKGDYKPKPGPHPWYSTYLVSAGALSLRIDDASYEIKNHGCVVIPPDTVFDMEIPSATEFIWFDWGVNRRALAMRSTSRGYRFKDEKPEPQPIEIFNQEWPVVLPEAMYETSLHTARYVACEWWKSKYAWLSANSCLSQWVLSIMCFQEQGNGLADEPLEEKHRIKQMAMENLPNVDSVEKWAQLVGVSVKTLDRMCHQYFECTSLVVLNQIRMERVQEVLVRDHVKVSAAATLLGFSSTATFSRWFKSHFNTTPSAWKKSVGVKQPHNAQIKGLDVQKNDFDQVR